MGRDYLALSFLIICFVLVAMIALMFIMIRILVYAVSRRVYSNVENMLYIYDNLFDKRKSRLRELSEEAYTNPAKPNAQNSASEVRLLPDLPAAVYKHYQDDSFLHKYRKIKNGFVIDKQAVVSEMVRRQQRQGIAKAEITESVAFDTLYALATLPADRQLAVLEETLTGAWKTALEQYQMESSLSPRPFDAVEFMQWQKQRCYLLDDRIIVKTASEFDDFSAASDYVQTSYDDELCEGIRIVTASRYYDFAISRKELQVG